MYAVYFCGGKRPTARGGKILKAYFDNSATTMPCENAVRAMNNACLKEWGNPSSLHFKGLEASAEINRARKSAASLLGCEESEIYFSPSGTAANNLAVLGSVNEKNKNLRKIVTTAMEHPSVSKCMDALEERGFEVIRLKPDKNGVISPECFSEVIDEKTALVSVMAVNNETGSVLPFDEIKRIIRRKKSSALLHVDAVQAFGKIRVNASSADMITASAHKIHALKGSGLLYVKKGVKLKPCILGGGQEGNLFSGTQNVPAIAAFGAAIEEARDIESHLDYVNSLNFYLRQRLSSLDGVRFNSPENALGYILNISVAGVRSQVTVNALSEMGICISAGSACSKGHRSETLVSMGLDAERIDSAVRISLSRYNTKEEIDLLYDGLKTVIESVK
ncbi:MAG: cysteine desulfurase [Ruminococcaceae bacterium]|nr:cysteine desulfurase [Oscillospiraceae bacterium]